MIVDGKSGRVIGSRLGVGIPSNPAVSGTADVTYFYSLPNAIYSTLERGTGLDVPGYGSGN